MRNKKLKTVDCKLLSGAGKVLFCNCLFAVSFRLSLLVCDCLLMLPAPAETADVQLYFTVCFQSGFRVLLPAAAAAAAARASRTFFFKKIKTKTAFLEKNQNEYCIF
ncbi:hypothetical protein [Methanimicrococcus hongohii]|uniref:hypothetical protein n=1 Tax=Methanimicrococcus hongohii TaxID=3028295 RepID=UPI002931B550|nr:hypothetical protein [Methanimicrococcus sp. Hf6]